MCEIATTPGSIVVWKSNSYNINRYIPCPVFLHSKID